MVIDFVFALSICLIMTSAGKATEVFPQDRQEEPTQRLGLPSLLPSLADMPRGTILAWEGVSQQWGGEEGFSRSFTGTGAFLPLGKSQLANLETSVSLHGSGFEARAGVLAFGALAPSTVAELFAQGVAKELGAVPEAVTVRSIVLPSIGDNTSGYIVTVRGTFMDWVVATIVFARDSVVGAVLGVGPEGQVDVQDLVQVAELIDRRIRNPAP